MRVRAENLPPTVVEQGVAAVMARVPDRKSLQAVAQVPGGIGNLVIPLALDPSFSNPFGVYASAAEDVNESLRRAARDPLAFFSSTSRRVHQAAADYSRTGVSEFLDTQGERLPAEVADKLTGVIIGTGAAGIVAGKVLSEIGIKQVTYISPDVQIGGIWSPADGPWGENKRIGYNNPAAISVFDARLPITDDRMTTRMQRFLSHVAGREMRSKITTGTVVGADFDGTKHTVYYQDGTGRERTLTADFVLVATGNHVLPLEGSDDAGYFSLENTESVPVKRWPSLLTDQEIRTLDENNQTVLCIGWGNSTMAKLREIEEINRKRGTNIRAVVLSHFSQLALDEPHRPTLQPDGKLRTVARDPSQGEYTKLELDLPESEDLYYRNLDWYTDASGAIIRGTLAGVTNCTLFTERGATNARVTTLSDYGREREYIIPNIGEIDAFTGFGNDPRLMTDLGFQVVDDYRGIVDTRLFDGRAITDHDGNLHAIGTTAYTRRNPSVRVIPGIIQQAKEVALTTATYAARAYAERENGRKTEGRRAPRKDLERKVLNLNVRAGSGIDHAYTLAIADNASSYANNPGSAVEFMDLLLQLQANNVDRTTAPVIGTFITKLAPWREHRGFAHALADLGTYLGMPVSVRISREDDYDETYQSEEISLRGRLEGLISRMTLPEWVQRQRRAFVEGGEVMPSDPVIKLEIRPKKNPNPLFAEELFLNEVVMV